MKRFFRDLVSAFPFGPVFFSGFVVASVKRASFHTSIGFQFLYGVV